MVYIPLEDTVQLLGGVAVVDDRHGVRCATEPESWTSQRIASSPNV